MVEEELLSITGILTKVGTHGTGKGDILKGTQLFAEF
jgi:hypothetical protein